MSILVNVPVIPVRIRTKINLQKEPLRFDKLFPVGIIKMSFLRGTAKGLAVPPCFYVVSIFCIDKLLSLWYSIDGNRFDCAPKSGVRFDAQGRNYSVMG